MKKLVLAAGFLAIATSSAWAQVYVYPSAPYGYGAGYYSYASPYEPARYAAAPGFYGFYGLIPQQTKQRTGTWLGCGVTALTRTTLF